MSQQNSSRFWLVIGMFLSLNATGLVWIRYAWSPRHPSRMVILDVSPPRASNPQAAPQEKMDDVGVAPTAVVATSPHSVAAPATVIEPARIVAWLPVTNATSALIPENVTPDESSADPSQSAASFDHAERLMAIFDRPIVDETRLNLPLEHSPFKISPAVAGHWRWTSPQRLVFVLDNPLPVGRRFELTAAVDFAEMMRTELASGSRRYEFQTSRLKWLGVTLQSCSRESTTFELSFNQPVSPEDLLQAMSISDTLSAGDSDPFDSESRFQPDFRGPTYSASVLTKEPAAKLMVQSSRPVAALRISIARKLTGHGADLRLESSQSRELIVPKAFAFVRSQVSPASFETAATVRLYFSAGLSADQETPKLKVSPAVDDLNVEFSPSREGLMSYHPGLVLRGAFQCGGRYSVTLPQTLLAHDGQTLGETSVQFEVPHRPADLRITGGQGILIPDGNLALDLQCVNIDGVRMSASRLHANNLVAFLQGRNDQATMRSLVRERTRSLDLPKDTPKTIALDLRQLLGAQPDLQTAKPNASINGIYRISIDDTNEYWNRDTATVAITDLGLTAKRGRDGWLVWVLSLRTAQPQAGVTVMARSFNNQVLAQATSDDTGIAVLNIPEGHADGPAWLLTAERNGDLNYLLPDRQGWMVDSVDQSGRAWGEHYDAMLYTERGVYRPGDTVHLTGILRDLQGSRPPAFPICVKVTRPDGRVVAELPCQPQSDRQGTFQIDYPSSASGQTGIYRFDVCIPGAKESLGSVTAQVEAFVPIRIAVDAAATQPRFLKESPIVRTTARYLFGQPAAGLSVTASGTWQRVPFQSKSHPDFRFGDFGGRNQQALTQVNGALGEDGECELTIASPTDERSGVWSANVAASVMESGGRTVSTSCKLEVDTAGVHLGIRPPEKQVVVVNQPTQIDWVIVDGHDAPVNSRPVRFTLSRIDYDTVIVQVNGRPVWKTVERSVEVQSNQIADEETPNGSINITCPTAGRYRLRLVDVQSSCATQIELYASTNRSDRVDVPLQQPEQLEIVLDQSKYRPGDTAGVLIRAPFPGQLLLTVESNRIHDRRIVTLEGNSQLIELPVPADLRGGAYVTATVIRGIDPGKSDWLPHRACGVARLEIDPSLRELPLKLQTSGQALPGSILKVRATIERSEVVAADQAKRPVVHLWAVDEGILLTTRYSTPRPLDFFHKIRKLGVSSADVYSDLLPDPLRPASMTRIGADKGEKSDNDLDALRRGPVDIPRAAPAVVWRTLQQISEDGSLDVDLSVPPLTGTLRVMAVVVDQDRYGSADTQVTVTSPLLVESTWPRAAAPGDSFRVPVKVFNTTLQPLEVSVRAVVSGPVATSFASNDEPRPTTVITVEPHKSHLQWLYVKGCGIGPVTARIEASATSSEGGSLDAVSENGMAFRSAMPLDSETSVVRHKVGEPLTLDAPTGFLGGTTRTSISISGAPSVELNPALDALIGYPYGCGEQTSSRLYALIAAQNWLASDASRLDKNTGTPSARQEFVNQLINAGVHRLWSMQNRNGGIGYWEHGDSNPWVSAYAAGAIVAARDAGLQIDVRFTTDLANYLERVLEGRSGTESDDNTRAYLCRILASLDKPKHGWMSRLSDRMEFLDAEGRAHLASAWIRLGRKDRAASVLPEDTFRLSAVASTSGRITSRVRQDAVLLQTLLELDPNHAAIPPLVQRLMDSRQKHGWMNTLENATAISALARYRTASHVPSEFTGTLRRGITESAFSHSTPLQDRWTADGEPLTIASQGQGEFYVVRTVEGLRVNGKVVPYDRRLAVRRMWLDRFGKPVDVSRLRVGDLIQVAIEITSADAREQIPNVAIVDVLPGGVEIENPRLATSAKSDGVAHDVADHVEFLDDRAVLFSGVTSHTKVFRYSVRVTTVGKFNWPPIQASSMYDPSVASIHGGGAAVVYGREEVIPDVAERPDPNAPNRN